MMRVQASGFAWLILTAGVLALAGCMSVADPTKYYVLSPTSPREPTPTSSASSVAVAVGVGPVLIPGYLNRVQIVTRDANDEVAVAMYDRWAEPLESGIAQVLADNLGAHVGSERIAVFPWRGGVARGLDYQVVVVVLRFEVWPGGQAAPGSARPTAKPPDLARHRKGGRCSDMSSAALTDFLMDFSPRSTLPANLPVRPALTPRP